MTSPLIPPQAVRRSPSVQLPHFMHLSVDTSTQVQFYRWGREPRAQSRWGSDGLPSRRPRRLLKRAATRARLGVLLVVAHRTLRAIALGYAPGLKQTGDVGDRLVVSGRLSAASSQRAHARGRTGSPWLWTSGCACPRSRHGTATRRSRCGTGPLRTLRQTTSVGASAGVSVGVIVGVSEGVSVGEHA